MISIKTVRSSYFYRLLEKHDGNLSEATQEELGTAKKACDAETRSLIREQWCFDHGLSAGYLIGDDLEEAINLMRRLEDE
jgi:hypothetical protein